MSAKEDSAGKLLIGEQKTMKSTREPSLVEKSAGELTTWEKLSKQATLVKHDGEAGYDEGEQSEGEVVEVTAEKPEVQRSVQRQGPPEQLIFHACLPPTAYTTLLDDKDADVDLLELDPDMHTDPEHRWDIATMTAKEALAS
ncbi:unnamed protein product [Closterium sp. NIES-54]